jgi:negative regulator of flagellin synthesis FlgM
MKIHNHVTVPIQTADKATGKPDSASAIRSAGTSPSVDSVSISDTSRALSTSGTAGTEAPFDAKRVSEIKAAISAGTFKVNPEAVADKVISSASQLLTSKS